MITLTKLSHASMILRTDSGTLVVDPVFDRDFSPGLRLSPYVAVDARKIIGRKPCTIFLSHSHKDHFHPATLLRFPRDTQIVYPKHSDDIGMALTIMGFFNCRELRAFDEIETSAGSLMATPSDVGPHELGFAFRRDSFVILNTVDSFIAKKNLKKIMEALKRVAVLICGFQPTMEGEACTGPLGGPFPLHNYRRFLDIVKICRPTYLLPGPDGLTFSDARWMNDRAFPMTLEKFQSDAAEISPSTKILTWGPGQTAVVARNVRVTPRTTKKIQSKPWRPHDGVPPLDGRVGNALEVRRKIAAFLDGAFLHRLEHDRQQTWVKKLERARAVWNLEIVLERGRIMRRQLDFGAARLTWLRETRDDFKVHTSVTANALLGAISGTSDLHSAVCQAQYRTFSKGYEISGGRVKKIDLIDPLRPLVFDEAYWRSLKRLCMRSVRQKRAVKSGQRIRGRPKPESS